MLWLILLVPVAWIILSFLLAMTLGTGISIADEKEGTADPDGIS
jgi:hypothetical protein